MFRSNHSRNAITYAMMAVQEPLELSFAFGRVQRMPRVVVRHLDGDLAYA